jgi:hypothetical protein
MKTIDAVSVESGLALLSRSFRSDQRSSLIASSTGRKSIFDGVLQIPQAHTKYPLSTRELRIILMGAERLHPQESRKPVFAMVGGTSRLIVAVRFNLDSSMELVTVDGSVLPDSAASGRRIVA